MKKKRKNHNSHRIRKIEKQKKKNKERKKRMNREKSSRRAIINTKRKYNQSEEDLKKKFASVTENIAKEIIQRTFQKIFNKNPSDKKYSSHKPIENFIAQNKYLMESEEKIFLNLLTIIDHLESKEFNINTLLNNIREAKEDLVERIEQLTEDRMFQLIEENDLSLNIEESVDETLNNRKSLISRLTKKINEAKGRFIHLIKRTFNKTNNKEEIETDNELILRVREAYEKILNEEKPGEDLGTKQLRSLKQWFFSSLHDFNREEGPEVIDSLSRFLSIDATDMIKRYFIKRFGTFQRVMDYYTSGIYDEIAENLAEVVKDSENNVYERFVLKYFINTIPQREDLYIIIENEPETEGTLLVIREIEIPSYTAIQKMRHLITLLRKSKFEAKATTFLYNVFKQDKEKCELEVIENIEEILEKEASINMKGWWDYIQKISKKSQISYMKNILQIIAISPRIATAFNNPNFQRIKPKKILRFLNEKEWRYSDGKTLTDVIAACGLTDEDIKKIISNTELFHFRLNSEYIKKLLDTPELMTYLKENKKDLSTLKKSLIVKHGLNQADKIKEMDEQDAIFVLYNIETYTDLEDYLKDEDKDRFLREKGLNDMIGENFSEIINRYSGGKEKIYYAISLLKQTGYFDELKGQKELFELFCSKLDKNYDKVIDAITGSVQKDPEYCGSLKDMLLSTEKKKKSLIKKVRIISGIITPETLQYLKEEFTGMNIELYDANKNLKDFNTSNEELVIYEVSHTNHSKYFAIRNICQRRNAKFIHTENTNKELLAELIKRYAFEE